LGSAFSGHLSPQSNHQNKVLRYLDQTHYGMTKSIIIMSDPGPEFLYRYRNIDGVNLEYLRRTLLRDEVFLAPPRTLNDPFDCRITFDCTKQPKHNVRAVIDRDLAFMEPGLTRRERRKRVTEELKLKLHKQPEFWKTITTEMQAEIDRQGVLCLSESPDSLLMWAHYAGGHQGVCLKFRHEGNRFFGRAQKVHYSDEPRNIDPFDGSLIGLRIAFLLNTKTTPWEYEKEWRIVDHDRGSGVQSFPPALLSGVILGMRIGESEREQIRSWLSLRSQPTELLQAKEDGAVLRFERL
jgi:hypothetical protein